MLFNCLSKQMEDSYLKHEISFDCYKTKKMTDSLSLFLFFKKAEKKTKKQFRSDFSQTIQGQNRNYPPPSTTLHKGIVD